MMKSVNQIRMSAILMAAAAILLAGCEKENENIGDNQPVKARITSVIDKMTTRAAGTAWAPGDRIGVYMATSTNEFIRRNLPYITTAGDGVFAAEGGEFYFENKENIYFSAYYPFEGTGGTVPGPDGKISKTITAADQTPAAQPKIDYLFADAIMANVANPNVQFSFKHCMSRIVFRFLPGDGINALSEIEYTVDGILPAGRFNTYWGLTEVDDATLAAPLTMTVPGNNASELSSALIFFPQKSDADKTLVLYMQNKRYSATFKFKENPKNGNVRELAAGHTYTYNVTITQTRMTITPATITDWENGGSEDIQTTI